jgi:hypothetical protein
MERLAFDADFALVIFQRRTRALFDDHGPPGSLPLAFAALEPFFAAEASRFQHAHLLGDAWNWLRVRSIRTDRSSWRRPITTSTRLRSWRQGLPSNSGAALTFLFTWGSIPSLYYGDEIGLRYLPGHAECRGRDLQSVLQPRRAAARRCSGTTRPECGLLHRASQISCICRSIPIPIAAHGRGAGRRYPARHCTLVRDLLGAAPRDASLAGTRVDSRCARGLSVRLCAWRLPPGGRQPAPGAGLCRSGGVRRRRTGMGIRRLRRCRPPRPGGLRLRDSSALSTTIGGVWPADRRTQRRVGSSVCRTRSSPRASGRSWRGGRGSRM